MNEEAKAILIANIEKGVDKMISEGRLSPDQREKTIEEYKKMARIA